MGKSVFRYLTLLIFSMTFLSSLSLGEGGQSSVIGYNADSIITAYSKIFEFESVSDWPESLKRWVNPDLAGQGAESTFGSSIGGGKLLVDLILALNSRDWERASEIRAMIDGLTDEDIAELTSKCE